MYFIISGREPYADLADQEMTARYSRMEFPDVQSFSRGRAIEGCWKGDLKSAQGVVDAISGDFVIASHDAAEAE